MVFAAGNDGENSVSLEFGAKGIDIVGAINKDGNVCDFSSARNFAMHSPTLDEAPLQQALIAAINHQLYRPEYLLAPFNRTLLESSSADSIPPAKSWPELYANLLEFQRRID